MMEQLTLLVRSLTISQRIGIVFGSLFSVLLLVGLVMWIIAKLAGSRPPSQAA